MNRVKGIQDMSNTLAVAATIDKISEADSSKVSPSDLEEFLPWACLKLGLDFVPTVVVKREQAFLIHPVKQKKSGLLGKTGDAATADDESEEKLVWSADSNDMFRNNIQVRATYAGTELTHLEIGKTRKLNRQLLTLISLIVEFFPYLQGMTLNCGIDQYTVYELCKVLDRSNITELYLDDTFVKEANYDLILDECYQLQLLSLCRCRIGDEVAKQIAVKLCFPRPASQKLCALNISSNRLTNSSMRSFAEALKTNRKLNYLNLAGNFISDDGGIAILKVMLQFFLTAEEVSAYRRRYMSYLLKRQEEIKRCQMSDLRLTDAKKLKAKKSITPQSKRDADLADAALNEKVDKAIGKYDDPYSDGGQKDGRYYCNGNNTLVYINFAYNNLSFKFLEWLLKVVQYQQSPERKFKGILNVRLEGNPMPKTCHELNTIDMYLDNSLSRCAPSQGGKKKPPIKNVK